MRRASDGGANLFASRAILRAVYAWFVFGLVAFFLSFTWCCHGFALWETAPLLKRALHIARGRGGGLLQNRRV